jgi:hypothetical protein
MSSLQIRLLRLAALAALAPTGASACADALPLASTGLRMSAHIGWKVNSTTGRNVCPAASNDTCQAGQASSGAGGFRYLTSVAADPGTGMLYVTDTVNSRVQEFTAAGAFVAMFGWDVNETKDRRSTARQTEKNVCTAASGDVCTAGVSGPAAGQLSNPGDVAVDPLTGEIYVLEVNASDMRLDKYSPKGHFLWMMGKHVNATTGGDMCSEREIERSGVKCAAGQPAATASTERGFNTGQSYGNLLAVGGPEHLLYVGDEHRVQEFDTNGLLRREILLVSISAQRYSQVAALAIDETGDLYLVYRTVVLGSGERSDRADVIREFSPNGEQIAQFAVRARQPKGSVYINGLAIDSSARLAMIATETGAGSPAHFGSLYDSRTGIRLADFAVPSDYDGVTFNGFGDLYIAATDDQEVAAYVPAPFQEPATSPVACELGGGADSSTASNCALTG